MMTRILAATALALLCAGAAAQADVPLVFTINTIGARAEDTSSPVKCLTPEGVEESCHARHFKGMKWPQGLIHPEMPNRQCWIETILALEAKRDPSIMLLKKSFEKLQSDRLSVLEAGERSLKFVRVWVAVSPKIERLCEAPA
jgi:hypothetical protein